MIIDHTCAHKLRLHIVSGTLFFPGSFFVSPALPSIVTHTVHDIDTASRRILCSTPTPPAAPTNTSVCRATESPGSVDVVSQLARLVWPGAGTLVFRSRHLDSFSGFATVQVYARQIVFEAGALYRQAFDQIVIVFNFDSSNKPTACSNTPVRTVTTTACIRKNDRYRPRAHPKERQTNHQIFSLVDLPKLGGFATHYNRRTNWPKDGPIGLLRSCSIAESSIAPLLKPDRPV